ncbi:MAG: hypothetical protein ACT4PZ_07115 [Panacagrimonas sp.]
MSTCFVMQPFDGAAFDKRYAEVFAPAIQAAGLMPYRVDQDPSVSVPINEIEKGIRDASICLAEITLDNPNVWFELGYAIACNKEVVLVCSTERTTKFPFDVQHRSIIRYQTTAPGDFKSLESAITTKIKAYLSKSELLTNISEMSKVSKVEGLEQHEIVALAALAENINHEDDNASTWQIKRDMETSGFTKMATMISLKSLSMKRFIETGQHQDGNGDYYTGYSLTETGWSWIIANKSKFLLNKDEIPF